MTTVDKTTHTVSVGLPREKQREKDNVLALAPPPAPLCYFCQEVQELAQSGMMDQDSTSKKSKGLLGDMKDVFGALSGGAHIVKREDGTL